MRSKKKEEISWKKYQLQALNKNCWKLEKVDQMKFVHKNGTNSIRCNVLWTHEYE